MVEINNVKVRLWSFSRLRSFRRSFKVRTNTILRAFIGTWQIPFTSTIYSKTKTNQDQYARWFIKKIDLMDEKIECPSKFVSSDRNLYVRKDHDTLIVRAIILFYSANSFLIFTVNDKWHNSNHTHDSEKQDHPIQFTTGSSRNRASTKWESELRQSNCSFTSPETTTLGVIHTTTRRIIIRNDIA